MKRFRIPIIAAVVCVVLVALYWGIRLRHDIYVNTDEIRFTKDVNNAYMWGRHARSVGLFNLYDRVANGGRFSAEVQLDYTPLRLMAVYSWQNWIQRNYANNTSWQREWEFTAPMLWGNTIAAMAASVFVFLIIRMWVIRMDDAQRSPSPGTPGEGGGEGSANTSSLTDSKSPHPNPLPAYRERGPEKQPLRGVFSGLFGALLLWFNPALLWNGYAWTQWDVWLVPFFLAAVYLACLDWWFTAGICLAIGASLKGQMLLAVPIMFLWPICQFRFGALLRVVAGFALVTMLIILPFLNASQQGFTWYMLMLTAMGLLAPMVLRWKIDYRWLIGMAVIAMLIAWPWISAASLKLQLLPVTLLAIIALSRFLPASLIPHSYALIAAGVIALLMPLFDASTAWFSQGYEYGPNRDQSMHAIAVNNLPAILQSYLRWPNTAHFKVWAPMLGDVEMQALMAIVYGICLLLCAIGAAIQYRRRDTRFLIAMFLPWLLFFLLLTQIRGRYLVWAAAMSALLAGNGLGMMLLGLLVTAVSYAQMVQNQHLLNRTYLQIPIPNWLPQLQATEPHLGWLLLLIAAISLYLILTPRQRL